MLFYRARLDGPAEVLDVSLSPVRPARRAAGAPPAVLGQADWLHGRVRVVLRYGPAEGPLRTHRGWLCTDLQPGRRLRLAGCQLDGGEVLLSLVPVPAGAGREHLRDRFRLPFHLNAWGVEAVTGVRAELFCIPTVRPGALALRGRGVVVLETPAARLVRAIPFCRRVAVELNAQLRWRARAAVEGVEVRVGPGGAVEGWLHVAVDCRGEPGPAGGAGPGMVDSSRIAAVAAVRRVDAAVKRLEAEVVGGGLALVSGGVELDVAWADRSGRGRWSSREVTFSALLPIAGLCEGDRLEPVAQVERLSRAGKGRDERAFVLVGVGLTALRAVHLELGGAWYRAERVVGQAVATVELNEPLFPRESRPAAAEREPDRRLELATGLQAPWTALRARIRRTGGRAALEVRVEPYGAGSARADERAEPDGDRSASATMRVELPGDPGAVLSLAAVGAQAVIRAGRPLRDGGVEVALPQGTATAAWHPLPVPARWAVDVLPHPGGVTCLVRGDGGLRRVALPGAGGVPAAVTVAGTVVPGAALNRLWVEAVNA
ncbi:hypothetical protein J2Z79_002760 [Symbiobacterium terraclitae]|uniref:Uncharacterized protein n=1 Tax=Symbiobacterium terraclitae TaxID=557451 RepID=A0ABS4JUV9_9FIRM|nr:hypothetical protein [Symbiobacterium terraclitae]MBP2019333.1 hypothetical protein [Symbiobacterium terraclitae]